MSRTFKNAKKIKTKIKCNNCIKKIHKQISYFKDGKLGGCNSQFPGIIPKEG